MDESQIKKAKKSLEEFEKACEKVIERAGRLGPDFKGIKQKMERQREEVERMVAKVTGEEIPIKKREEREEKKEDEKRLREIESKAESEDLDVDPETWFKNDLFFSPEKTGELTFFMEHEGKLAEAVKKGVVEKIKRYFRHLVGKEKIVENKERVKSEILKRIRLRRDQLKDIKIGVLPTQREGLEPIFAELERFVNSLK